jgi:hypothetical protein
MAAVAGSTACIADTLLVPVMLALSLCLAYAAALPAYAGCSCRSHIESLIAAAAAQQVQSELAVRVSSWRSRIDPILAAEEDRSAFDIHDYGSKILTRLQDTKQQPEDNAAAAAAEAAAKEAAEQLEQQQQNDAAGGEPEIVDFKQVAGASDSFEVCRLFAAMLQLVNNRWAGCRAGGTGRDRAMFYMWSICSDRIQVAYAVWGGELRTRAAGVTQAGGSIAFITVDLSCSFVTG